MEHDLAVEKPIKARAPVHPGPAEGWNPFDEYDCRLEADSPKQTQEYIDNTRPHGVKEAIAKRQAELDAARTATADPKTSGKDS
jgi:hypothetical protein